MATRKIHGGAMSESGRGGGGNKDPFKLGNFKPGPQNTTGVMNNSNNNFPKTRRIKKKHSGASAKKGFNAKKYRNNTVLIRNKSKSRVNAHVKGRTLRNIQETWRRLYANSPEDPLVRAMKKVNLTKEKKKTTFKNN